MSNIQRLLSIVAVYLFSLYFSSNTQLFQHQALEENDLWREDSVTKLYQVDRALFDKIISLGLSIYTPIAKQNNDKLSINGLWNDSTVNAGAFRVFGSAIVNIFGGLARRPEITPDALALVMCHELGHLYGGAPYMVQVNKMSAEGQSDYYGAQTCLKLVLPLLDTSMDSIEITDFTKARCLEKYPASDTDYNICLRQLAAGQSQSNLFTATRNIPASNYETPDTTVVTTTETSYPKNVQCRLDTYLNATMFLDRPACWFKN